MIAAWRLQLLQSVSDYFAERRSKHRRQVIVPLKLVGFDRTVLHINGLRLRRTLRLLSLQLILDQAGRERVITLLFISRRVRILIAN